jgi:hypothetical protein
MYFLPRGTPGNETAADENKKLRSYHEADAQEERGQYGEGKDDAKDETKIGLALRLHGRMGVRWHGRFQK